MDRAPEKWGVTSSGRGRSETPWATACAREVWIRRYTGRILEAWFRREAPLGLTWTYANWIRKRLSDLYEQPLLKAFVERTFREPGDRVG
jgi:hypothetical protein